MIYGNVFLKEGMISEKFNAKYIKNLIDTGVEGNILSAYNKLYSGIEKGKLSAKTADELIQYIKSKLDGNRYNMLIGLYNRKFPSEKKITVSDSKIVVEDQDKFIKSVLAPKIKKYISEVNKDENIKKKAKANMDKIEDRSDRSSIRLSFDDSEIDDGYFILCDESQEARIALCCMIDAVIDKLRKDTDINKYKVVFDSGDGDEGCIYYYFNK